MSVQEELGTVRDRKPCIEMSAPLGKDVADFDITGLFSDVDDANELMFVFVFRLDVTSVFALKAKPRGEEFE